MVVTNNYDAISKLGLMMTGGNKVGKENKLATGQKVLSDDAASLTISDRIKNKMKTEQEAEDIAAENMRASESNVIDIAKADEMIRQANKNILDQADDAVKVQSGQSTDAVKALLN